ncbi:MAG: FtsK/SpoIIIE domain-containing protein, partial [Nocardioides sp.]
LRGGSDIVIATPRPSPLRTLAGRPGVRGIVTGAEWTTEELRELIDPGEVPVVLLIDDGELCKNVPAGDYLKTLLRTGRDHRRAVVLGGDCADVASGFTGWQIDAKGRAGLLLSPQSVTDGDLIGVRLTRSSIGTGGPIGRGLANLGDGKPVTVQVPLLT